MLKGLNNTQLEVVGEHINIYPMFFLILCYRKVIDLFQYIINSYLFKYKTDGTVDSYLFQYKTDATVDSFLFEYKADGTVDFYLFEYKADGTVDSYLFQYKTDGTVNYYYAACVDSRLCNCLSNVTSLLTSLQDVTLSLLSLESSKQKCKNIHGLS